MRTLKEFSIFGARYRTMQLGAVAAFEAVKREDAQDPIEACRTIEVLTGATEDGDEIWIMLDTRAKINQYVREPTGFVPAHEVLSRILAAWLDANAGVLRDWKPVRVPGYLKSDVEARQAPGVEPILATIISSGRATLKELSVDYSLEDALHIFDVLIAANVTQADASYRAAKEAKRRR